MELTEGTVVAGKYRLEAPFARGGMGTVWAARHTALGSQLAVKFIDPSYARDATFLARFEREARAAAAIQSPHVVHVQDFGVEDGSAYLVMELLHGEDLGMRLRRSRRLSLADTARIVVQLGRALRRAHEAGIVHRDLKPANLFLAQIDDAEVVKVLDFGIAKEAGAHVGESTKTGEVVGSPHYMAPEQARADKDVDHRSDLWSVGVIAYRMLTGTLPFPGDVMGAVLARLLVEPPPLVGSIVPELPAALDGFFARALAKKREDRFQDIRELVAAFLAIAEQRDDLPSELRGPTSGSTSGPLPGPAPEANGRTPLPSIPSFASGAAAGRATPLDPRTPTGPSGAGPSEAPAASLTGPSIATSVNTVAPAESLAAPRRRSWLLPAIAAGVVVVGASVVVWTGGSATSPAGSGAASPGAASSAGWPPDAPGVVTPAPVPPSAGGPASGSATGPGGAVAPATASAAASAEPSAEPSAGSSATAPVKSATAKGAAPPPPVGTKKRDDWGF